DQLQKWSRTGRDYDGDRTVAELFEECAARMPDNVAVECQGRKLTYGELNGRANRLGHYLRTLGVKPETRVAIGVERGLEMVVGMVGVLKAGGAYVPLDLSYPVERLRFIVRDSAPVALLVGRRDGQGLADGIAEGVPVIDLSNESVFRGQPETNL